MRNKLFRGILLIVVLCVVKLSFAEENNPLSIYSPMWNQISLQEANTVSLIEDLTSIEKDFIHVFNLARLKPTLFKETVLAPYSKQKTYTTSAYNVLSQLANQDKLPMLSFSKMLRGQVKEQLTSNSLSGENELECLRFELDSTRGALMQVTAENAVQMFLSLLTANGECGYIFRTFFAGDDDLIGLTISRLENNKYLIAFILEHDATIKSYINKIDLSSHPNDKVLTSFDQLIAKKHKSFLYNDFLDDAKPILISMDEMEKLSDHLFKEFITNVQYEYHYHLKAVEPNNVQSVREEELNLSYYKKSEPILFDADSAVNYYSITRNINPNDSSSSVSIKHLKTEPPSIPFPADSIGNYIDTISFSKVDSFVTAFSKQIDEKKLGYNLTKPWKKEIEKVRAIFMWMRQNIQYDYVGLTNGKLTYLVPDIFKKRVAVCEGYANMFDYLCNQAGIKSYKLTGYVYPKQLHAWNTVCIDKKWYLVDVTWGMHYFLLEPALFLKDHYCTMRKWLLLTKPIKLIEWEEYAKKAYEKTTDDMNKNY